MRRADVEHELARLPALSSVELRREWARVTARPCPAVSPAMLRLALAWELQADVHGGLSRRTQQRLDQIAGAKTRTAEVRPGMRLVREWNGTVHVVTIAEDRVIHWNGQTWNSLSEVARAITGTRWSGPAFFGLRQKRKAA